MLGKRGQPNLVQFKRHDGDGDIFIKPAHVAMVEPGGTGDANVTDVVVAAQAGLALATTRHACAGFPDGFGGVGLHHQGLVCLPLGC